MDYSDEYPRVEPGQLNLFDEAERHLVRGRRALANFDLEAARDRFASYLARYPENQDALHGHALATLLLSRLAEAYAAHKDPVEALLALEADIPDVCRKGWHRAVAREAERRMGAGWVVAGKPVGMHWLQGGAPKEASRSLAEYLRQHPMDIATRVCLADLLFEQGEVDAARREYLAAFFIDPQAVDVPKLADPDVAALPEVGYDEYQLDGPDWVPAVGTVEGVFRLPPPVVPGIPDILALCAEKRLPGLDFYRCLVEERAAIDPDVRVEKRRQMKKLCPGLLAAYLERRVTLGDGRV